MPTSEKTLTDLLSAKKNRNTDVFPFDDPLREAIGKCSSWLEKPEHSKYLTLIAGTSLVVLYALRSRIQSPGTFKHKYVASGLACVTIGLKYHEHYQWSQIRNAVENKKTLREIGNAIWVPPLLFGLQARLSEGVMVDTIRGVAADQAHNRQETESTSDIYQMIQHVWSRSATRAGMNVMLRSSLVSDVDKCASHIAMAVDVEPFNSLTKISIYGCVASLLSLTLDSRNYSGLASTLSSRVGLLFFMTYHFSSTLRSWVFILQPLSFQSPDSVANAYIKAFAFQFQIAEEDEVFIPNDIEC